MDITNALTIKNHSLANIVKAYELARQERVLVFVVSNECITLVYPTKEGIAEEQFWTRKCFLSELRGLSIWKLLKVYFSKGDL